MVKQLDICFSRHKGNPESRGAYERTKDKLSNVAHMVFLHIKLSGREGCTADEVSVDLDLMLHTISARFTELKKRKLIEKIGTRRTRSGCQAGVFVVVE